MTAISSMHLPKFGYRSETSIPDFPHFVNFRGVPSKFPGLRTFSRGSLSRLGMGSPCRLLSSGLGSHVSIWLGPPYINSTMQLLALAGKWDLFGWSGEGAVASSFA